MIDVTWSFFGHHVRSSFEYNYDKLVQLSCTMYIIRGSYNILSARELHRFHLVIIFLHSWRTSQNVSNMSQQVAQGVLYCVCHFEVNLIFLALMFSFLLSFNVKKNKHVTMLQWACTSLFACWSYRGKPYRSWRLRKKETAGG